MSASRYAAAALLNALFGKSSALGALASVPTLYVALCTAAPTDTSTGSTLTEANYTGYARVATAASDWNAAVAGSPTALTNLNAINFATCTGGSSTVTHIALVDAATNGNVIAFSPLSSNLAVSNNIVPQFSAGQLQSTLA